MGFLIVALSFRIKAISSVTKQFVAYLYDFSTNKLALTVIALVAKLDI